MDIFHDQISGCGTFEGGWKALKLERRSSPPPGLQVQGTDSHFHRRSPTAAPITVSQMGLLGHMAMIHHDPAMPDGKTTFDFNNGRPFTDLRFLPCWNRKMSPVPWVSQSSSGCAVFDPVLQHLPALLPAARWEKMVLALTCAGMFEKNLKSTKFKWYCARIGKSVDPEKYSFTPSLAGILWLSFFEAFCIQYPLVMGKLPIYRW